ncbi:MAG: hypothetical protein H7Z11_15705 [Verrucomicrobia bacterium]|nr:hypothetical protein [Leptolyngbya sp. ES-bin-22]
MGRRKSVAELQKQLQYAQARAAYKPPALEEGGTIRKQSKTPVKYGVLVGSAAESLTVQASTAGLAFFGGLAPLGLADAAGDPRMASGSHPSVIKATVGDGTPSRVRAKGSNRPYIRYAQGTRGSNVQSSFSAPISADSGTALKTKFNTVADTIKGKLGGSYGRVWLEPERLVLTESGGN